MKSVGIIIGDITKRNGTERAVTSLSTILAEHIGISTHIISIESSSGSSGFPLSPSVICHHLNLNLINNKQSKIKNLWTVYHTLPAKIKKICYENRLDAIIGSDTSVNCLLTLIPSKIKRIACEHFNYRAFQGVTELKRRLAYPYLDAIVLLTERDAANYTFIQKDRKFVIPNNLPFTPPPKTLSTFENKQIVAVGRFSPQKGFDLLIETMKYVHPFLPDWKLDIYGRGKEKERLISLIHQDKLENTISICDYEENILKVYQNASIYALSSRWEGFGLVLIEAMACGLPCIAFDIDSGPSEIITHGVDGYLISPFNTKEFAERIISLAQNKGMYETFSKNSMANVQRFSLSAIVEKWKSLLDKLGLLP